jgi:hypothetical protein
MAGTEPTPVSGVHHPSPVRAGTHQGAGGSSKNLRRLRSVLAMVLPTVMTLTVALPRPVAASTNATAPPLQLAQALAADPSVIVGAAYVAEPPTGTPNAVMTTPLAGFPTNGGSYTFAHHWRRQSS